MNSLATVQMHDNGIKNSTKLCAVHRQSMYKATELINNAFAISSFQKTIAARDVFMTILIIVLHEPSCCNELCYEVIMKFMPVQNLLIMIRLFRLLASY